ncbi:hypothetical protein [Methylobacterium soli]|uniref:Uncharacterized protein n=1 Tax=Methylobacterium soli TaxID=553447 RepID=A0A6L3SU62_9HYPH|nr:hypothetical protein [Methylobacterium soli]KAB1077160.1 hypothetical protein F6X53_19960 [Methylobacterium soli]GJE44358.1 hypothetical protein AEGHOMDF_3546 [Methylobacterium soli]
MPSKAAWVMSESDTFDLLNAIDQRLATARLDEQQHSVLVRLRSLLEDDPHAPCEREIMPLTEMG